ncbi:hypothetical protein KO488_08345 [Poseidonibacter lekithochrous]|uniref:hypothetical protein n=1 Tax=Poseidonibacter TaxID=2321187 RepID=UPI001C09FA39|nr:MULTISPECIES: hypothetical protein [Poseidonibacter]MBU3014764.1 hypothetical protein [Poseidonibacter lekithochrous]MDO6828062.1 hypothetical protein [Poseidonibacter sp. 1_MG-2023]
MKRITREQLEDLKILSNSIIEAIDEYSEKVLEYKDDATEYADDRSEKWQDSENGDIYLSWIDDLESKSDEILELKDAVENINFDDVIKPGY